jgi:hypothetical protein
MADSRDGSRGRGAYNSRMAIATNHPAHTDVCDAIDQEGIEMSRPETLPPGPRHVPASPGGPSAQRARVELSLLLCPGTGG